MAPIKMVKVGPYSLVRGHEISLCPPSGKILVFWKFDIRKTYRPLMGPLVTKYDPTYPHTGLRLGTYLSNKPKHFKEIRA